VPGRVFKEYESSTSLLFESLFEHLQKLINNQKEIDEGSSIVDIVIYRDVETIIKKLYESHLCEEVTT